MSLRLRLVIHVKLMDDSGPSSKVGAGPSRP